MKKLFPILSKQGINQLFGKRVDQFIINLNPYSLPFMIPPDLTSLNAEK